MKISIGLRRSLQQCALPNHTFAMLAIDQRGSLINAMKASSGKDPEYAEITAFKRDVIRTLSPHASAVLVDVEYGYAGSVTSSALSGQAGALLSMEFNPYGSDKTRPATLVKNWSVKKARIAGASGIKLLIYYRPDGANVHAQEKIVAKVAERCDRWQIPLFLEPLHYSLDPAKAAVSNAERRRLVIESAKRLVPLGVHVLKAEFPVNVKQTSDEQEWAGACQELSAACPVPWVLLSAGVDYETFVKQVRVACANGASGILCGRAVWKDTIGMTSEARQQFLATTAVERFNELRAIVESTARPFTEIYKPSDGDKLRGWYK
jgi:tagatose 1,6-diphosphate aldolase